MVKTADDPITHGTAPADAPHVDVPVSESVTPGRVQRNQRTRLRAAMPRRTRVTIRHVGIWSVFRLSVIFYLCAMLVLWLALLIIYLLLQAGGVLDTVSEWVGCLVNEAESTRACMPVDINGTAIFTYLFLVGIVFAGAWALINTFVAVMYNLISDLVGGVDVTLSEKRAD